MMVMSALHAKIRPQEKPDDGDGDNTKHMCSEEQVHRKEGLNFAKSSTFVCNQLNRL